jgi:hypothetical protein
VVRRKRQESGGLPVPRHLWPDAVKPDPLAWRDERFEWAKQHDWPTGKLGLLEFFRETRKTYRSALKLD